MNRLFLAGISFIILLTSCGVSKSVKELMETPEYGIKKVHIEERNSTYDDLVSDYVESLKSENQKFAEKLAKDTLVSMHKGPCLGNCPVYTITVYNNGKVKLDGVSFIPQIGIYESKLEEDQHQELKALVKKVDLIRMSSRYPPSVDMVKDVARTSMVIADASIKFKTTIGYGEPQTLKDLQTYLTQLLNELSWVQI